MPLPVDIGRAPRCTWRLLNFTLRAQSFLACSPHVVIGSRSGHRRKALANESAEVLLVVERIQAADDAARAVAEQKDRQPRFARLHERDERGDIADVFRKRIDVKALAIGTATAAKIDRVRRHAVCILLTLGR